MKTIRHWWHAAILGGLVGLPIGVCLEIARKRFQDYRTAEAAAEFERRFGSSAPLMIDFLQPWVVPILTTIASVTVAVGVYITLKEQSNEDL